MIQKSDKADYSSFMRWFAKNYPEMFRLHRETIIPAKAGEGVTVDEDSMSAGSFKEMIAITQEYYKNEAFDRL